MCTTLLHDVVVAGAGGGVDDGGTEGGSDVPTVGTVGTSAGGVDAGAETDVDLDGTDAATVRRRLRRCAQADARGDEDRPSRRRRPPAASRG